MNTENSFNNIDLNNTYIKNSEKSSILNIINRNYDNLRGIIFIIEIVFALFIIIFIFIIYNEIVNIIKIIENLPNILKNGITSIL